MFFRDTELYRQTHSDAHKERATEIAAPALTWHMAFLIPRRQASGGPDDPAVRYSTEDMKAKLDGIIVALVRHLRRRAIDVRISPRGRDGVAILFDRFVTEADPDRPVTGMPTQRQLAILAGDERAVLLTFPWTQDGARWNMTVRIHLRTNLFTVTVIAQNGEETMALADAAAFDRRVVAFWDDFTGPLLRSPLAKLLRSDILHGVFADIRGVVVPSATFGDESAVALPDDASPPARWPSEALMARLTPLVTADGQFECIASTMLKRRVLHLTALGPQPVDYPDHIRMPITFLLCVRPDATPASPAVSARQLGLLIERMHLVGTLRLAALLDLALLRKASSALSQIDRSKRRARDMIEQYEKNEIAAEDTRGAMEAARQTLNAIGRDFFEANAAGVGLSFRIESSRYYVSQFQSNLPGLQLGTVDGYQRYDQFVERRLGTTFEFIDRLGTRFERALNDMAAVDQSFASIQTRHTGTAVMHNGKAVEHIQRNGELILLMVLVPYYVIGTYHYLVSLQTSFERLFFPSLFSAITAFALFVFLASSSKESKGAAGGERLAALEKSQHAIRVAVVAGAAWFVLLAAVAAHHEEEAGDPIKAYSRAS